MVLLARTRTGPSWPAGIVFGLAAITDQLDGWLARRWSVESGFGKVADPLADRLMIDVCVVLLVVYDRLPWIALVILLRDLAPRRRLQARRAARLRVRGLPAREDRDLGAVRLARRSFSSPSAARGGRSHCFWVSLGLAVVAAAQYVAKAMREVRR